MSKKPKPVTVGRIIIQTPEQQAADAARLLKGQFARTRAGNQKRLARSHGSSPVIAGTYATTSMPVRPGADDALSIPSRHGDRLHYRDGRVVDFYTGASI